MIPNLDHLFWLRHDKERFEQERNRLVTEYIKSVPEEHRAAAYAMQCKIDLARMTLSPEEFLKWMQREMAELGENLADQFAFIGHKAQDIKAQLRSLSNE